MLDKLSFYLGTSDPLSRFGPVFSTANLNGTNGFMIAGRTDAGTQFGFDCSIGGDLNGDGYADALLGTNNGGTGEAYVLLGSNDTMARFGTSFNISSLNGANGFILSPGSGSGNFGFAADSEGDFNGDGFDDVVVGARSLSRAYILFGTSNVAERFTSLFDPNTLNNNNGFFF